ncbi:hypothetical protein LMG18090_02826 [Ralstonia mannitolilytica]|nr:hypothetical protein LMG18090_02826 [Ralstonia mannitolilytica]
MSHQRHFRLHGEIVQRCAQVVIEVCVNGPCKLQSLFVPRQDGTQGIDPRYEVSRYAFLWWQIGYANAVALGNKTPHWQHAAKD